jgi:opacity protein-like surface antigen
MRKTFLTVLGSALIVATSVQFADAAERHHGKADRAAVTQQQIQTRNADAYAAWPAPVVQPDWAYRYSGGYSAPAGR